jgi:hypothetical protein
MGISITNTGSSQQPAANSMADRFTPPEDLVEFDAADGVIPMVNTSLTVPMQTGVAQTSMAIQSKQTTLPHFARSRTEPTKSQGPTEADVAPMTQTQIPDYHDYDTAAHNVEHAGNQGSDDHVFKFPDVDLNDRANAALIRRDSSDVDVVKSNVSSTFVYVPLQGRSRSLTAGD